MFNGLSHKEEIYGGLHLSEESTHLRFRKLVEEKRRKEESFSTGTFEKGIQTSKAKNELVFSLVRIGSVLYTNGVLEAGKGTLSFFMRLKHGDLIQAAYEFVAMARENSALLKKAGLNRTAVQELQRKLEKFQASLEEKVLNFC
ncbi:MAG TPA: hypothetical protein VHO03_02265 [Ignavibacteriales bacterium]|nr:hypothetical protein [Ignavibacteriales bacterium]